MSDDEQQARRDGLPPAGWLPDPSGLHELRYWTGTGWTKHVRDGETPSVDIAARGLTLEDELRVQPERHRGLRAALAVLGVVFLLLVLTAGSCALSLAAEGRRLDRESQAYADETITAVCEDWNQSEFESRLSPEFWEITSRPEVDQLFDVLGRLGPLESSEASSGESRVVKFIGREDQITAVYVIDAEFENGPARITLTLIKHGDEWQVLGFNVNSMALFDD